MTAGDNGASTPEDDDPFGYLYADGQASGATPPTTRTPSSPVRSHQIRTVGERRYGQAGQGGYGYPPPAAAGRQPGPAQQPPGRGGHPQPGGQAQTAALGRVPQQGYHQPNAHYQAPETLPGGGQGTRQGSQGYRHGGRGRGPNTKGLLIGAIAVVVAVVAGIGMAVLSGGDDDKDNADGGGPTQSSGHSSRPDRSAGQTPPAGQGKLPKTDAQTLQLSGGAATASDITGAKANGGVYVAGLNNLGASATWTVPDIQAPGKYTLHVGYGVPGKDADATLTINGTPLTTPLNLKNFANAAEGDWEGGWTSSYAYIELNKGSNTVTISCQQGNQCDANLDQLWLEKGWKE